jgi:zinc transporter
VILYLRAVNQNEGEDPHDMLTMRLWATAGGIISLRGRRVFSPEAIHNALEQNHGPKGSGDFLVALVEQLTVRKESVLEEMRDRLDSLEQITMAPRDRRQERLDGVTMRRQLGQLRVAAVALRRYLAPQRDAINRLSHTSLPWLLDEHKVRLRELGHDLTRHVEDLDEISMTAGIIQDQVASAMSENLNDMLFKLTLLSAFFMPLSFLVGFFGSNTSGMFFGGDPSDPAGIGALYETILLVGVGAFELMLFRWLKWV